MKDLLKDAVLHASAPVRYALRHELMQVLAEPGAPEYPDLDRALQRLAMQSTADYVYKHMQHAEAMRLAWPPLGILTKAVEAVGSPGARLLCEFGVFSGATINHIASLIPSTKVYGFDSFEGLPESWRQGRQKGCFRSTQVPAVADNVTLVKGWFDKTLPAFLKEHPEDAALLHIDCDLYSSTQTVFEHFKDRIKPGCVIAFDEYFNYPGWEEGEHRAFQEFISTSGLGYEYIYYNSIHEQVVVKIKE